MGQKSRKAVSQMPIRLGDIKPAETAEAGD
jgi:hypothetical protein